MNARYVTDAPKISRSTEPQSITSEPRFELRRLCECSFCGGTGKTEGILDYRTAISTRCSQCRGEGRILQLVASCDTPEAVGVALITLSREGEFEDCPFGLLDREGEPGLKWLVRPWPASPRTVSDAGKMLRATQLKGEK